MNWLKQLSIYALEYQLDFWLSLTLACHGWALAAQGAIEMGIVEMEKGISGFQAAGGEFILSHYEARLAEQYGKKGRVKARFDNWLTRHRSSWQE